MLRFLKSDRIKMLKKSNFIKYLLYAIGEIFLVVVGILFALEINNWSEKRKVDGQLNSILRTISYDLSTDTLTANIIIQYYEEHHESSMRLINGEIDKNNFKECPKCGVLVTSYQPFTVQKKGYELLKNFSSEHTAQRDSLSTDIAQFYPIFIELIEKSNDRLETDVLKNLEKITKHSWFLEMARGKATDEIINYFSESDEYKKIVASHDILASQNHLALLKQYKANAVEILKLIEERFVKKKK